MARILTARGAGAVTGSPLTQRMRIAITATVALAILLVFATHYAVTASMIAIYERNETFAHCWLVVPMVLWLVWRRGDVAAARAGSPAWYSLASLLVAACISWLGMRVNAAFVAQFAMVAMVPLLVWSALGTAATAELVVPLLLLFFVVPFGDFLVPQLIEWTGNFVVLAIQASGVPVFREGNLLTIPTGRWSIIEACAGLRYLIASVLVGVLFAYLSYRSWTRRIAFVAASIAVPIVANWLRAYMIVMLGHLTNNRLAVGVDHIIYGWLFFGIVMLVLFAVGARWREDLEPASGEARADAATRSPGFTRLRDMLGSPAAIAGAVIVAVSALAQATMSVGSPTSTTSLTPVATPPGWHATDRAPADWRPDINNATVELRQSFARGDREAAIFVALFRNQTREAKAVASTNQLVEPMNQRFVLARSGGAALEQAGPPFAVNTATVSDGRHRFGVLQWFWVDGHRTDSRYVAGFWQALAVLRGRDDAVAWVIVYGVVDERGDDTWLRELAAVLAPSIDATLQAGAAKP